MSRQFCSENRLCAIVLIDKKRRVSKIPIGFLRCLGWCQQYPDGTVGGGRDLLTAEEIDNGMNYKYKVNVDHNGIMVNRACNRIMGDSFGRVF